MSRSIGAGAVRDMVPARPPAAGRHVEGRHAVSTCLTLSRSDRSEDGRTAGSAAVVLSENAFEFRIQHAKRNVLSNDGSPTGLLEHDDAASSGGTCGVRSKRRDTFQEARGSAAALG
jgi:hypothetical protein